MQQSRLQLAMQAIAEDYRRRPLWMNLIFYFCVYMTLYLHAI
jgi:hypothetical protein